MTHRQFTVTGIPKLQRITSVEQLDSIEFTDGLAEVEVPAELLDKLPLKNHERSDGPRLQKLIRSMRERGYSSLEPIIVRIGRRGRWVVVDGGHRLTAAMQVSKEFWTNLLRRKIGAITFILFETPISYSKLRDVAPHADVTPERLAVVGDIPE